MKLRITFSVLAAVVIISGLSYAGWKYVRDRSEESCTACRRPVHGDTRTTALIDGQRKTYCCPACALSEHRQTGRSVELTSLTDYLTRSPVRPADGFLVRGSDVQSCSHAAVPVGLDKHPMTSHFDRCSPSLIAFARRPDAEAFTKEHGGRVLAFTDIAGLYK